MELKRFEDLGLTFKKKDIILKKSLKILGVIVASGCVIFAIQSFVTLIL